MSSLPIVLASRSPRRIELLRLIVPPDRILVRPPPSSEEAGFEGLTSIPQIVERLQLIARHKYDQTQALLDQQQQPYAALIAADTTVVASDSDGRPIVLGQPPEGPDRNDLVRRWFVEYYAGREHRVFTGVCLSVSQSAVEAPRTFVVGSTVTFTDQAERFVDWYLQTGEPAGKAGGYALQGAGSLFIDQVTGSLSNVVGLPIREVRMTLVELGLDVDSGN